MLPILIIYTGGTIGMQPSEQGYLPSDGIQALIKDSLNAKQYAALAPFSVHEFEYLIDSSNAQPSDWLNIAECITENYRDFSAFIVLHGTDTMAYTASALHHILGDRIKPVIVTGSQIPLCEARSDAITNLLDAALFARNANTHQVSLSFAGKLLAAYSATKVNSSALAAFDSPNKTPMATANIQLELGDCNNESSLQTTDFCNFNLPSITANSVAVLFLYPGISNEVIDATLLNKNSKAVVMLSYGAGNPPDQNQYLISALHEARKRGIVVVNKTQCHAGAVAQGSYAVGSILNELGVISAQDRTLEDLITDLYINFQRYT
ncbi:MAG: L-asparaginase [Oceanospirillaceae bacterium]|jgi:L-asparaginase